MPPCSGHCDTIVDERLRDIDFFSEVINEFSALEAGKHPKYSYAHRVNALLHVCFTDDDQLPVSVTK
jgi:hypothetical protein